MNFGKIHVIQMEYQSGLDDLSPAGLLKLSPPATRPSVKLAHISGLSQMAES
jgi:hypothetical protein